MNQQDLDLLKKNIRVAWISDIFDEVSGVITDTVEFYEQARSQDVSWFPVSCYNKNLYPFHIFKPVLKLPTGSFYQGTYMFVPQFLSIVQYLRKNKVNIIVSNTPATMGMVAMAAAKYLRIPWVDIYHTDVDFYMDVLNSGLLKPLISSTALFFLRQYQKQADLIFYRTEEYKELLIKKGHNEKKLRSYPAGVNFDKFNPGYKDRSIWSQYQISTDKIVVLYVGRITKVKDIHFLLNYFRDTAPQNAELVLVGGGPEKDEYEKEYGQVPHVHFLGVKRDKELLRIYASADLYVLPSASETLGKTVLEALASAVPVVVSDKGGPKDYITDGLNGRIFKAGDDSDFQRVISEVLNNAPVLAKMQLAARDSIAEFTDKVLFDKFLHNVGELLAPKI